MSTSTLTPAMILTPTATVALVKTPRARKPRVRKPRPRKPVVVKPNTSTVLPLPEYDLIVVALSGGKDSVYCLLEVLERCDALGVPRERVEAWHHLVDGAPGERLVFDWPCTDGYCAALCASLGVAYRRSWREGGILGEMMKENDRSKAVTFELPEGGTATVGGTRGKIGTRLMYPAASSDLQTRWCSAHVKIDVCTTALCGDPRLKRAKVLVVTGERREESNNRAGYAEVERRKGTQTTAGGRRVDQWRLAIDRTEAEVWAKLEKHHVRPHPAYYLGFGRTSCMTCVFNTADAWATVRALAPERFAEHAGLEQRTGKTIKFGLTVLDQADRGRDLSAAADPAERALAMAKEYPVERVRTAPGTWRLPAGAFRKCGGPT